MWTILKVFIAFLTILFLFLCFDFFFFFGQEECGILASWWVFKPTSPALEGEVLTTGPLVKAPKSPTFKPDVMEGCLEGHILLVCP